MADADLHLCRPRPGGDLRLGQACPWIPSSDLHLGYQLPGADLSLGLPPPAVDVDTAQIAVAAIAPAPSVAAYVKGPYEIEVLAVAPAPAAGGLLLQGRSLFGIAVAPAPTASASARGPFELTGVAVAPAPAVSALSVGVNGLRGAAVAPAPKVLGATAYDANLLSDIVAPCSTSWSPAALAAKAARTWLRQAETATQAQAVAWTAATPARAGPVVHWTLADLLSGAGGASWRAAQAGMGRTEIAWRQAERVISTGKASWQQGLIVAQGPFVGWRDLPRRDQSLITRYRDGAFFSEALATGFAAGARMRRPWVTRWRDAGYPRHWLRIRPPRPPPPRPVGPPARLCLGRALPGAALHLGQRCLILPVKRWYYVFNTASLVRLPDRLPLPCTAMTLSADCDSWAWSLSATLVGAEAFSLVAPQAPAYLPVEVEATVNGYVWQFLLDSPNHARAFARDTVHLSGRSRAAWLSAPYVLAETGDNAAPTTAQQAAELVLENSGWKLDWQLVDWQIPAGVLRWEGTPIERLIQLAAPVDGCVLADLADDLIRIYPRYAAPPWEWAEQLPDVLIPESVPRTLQRRDDRRPLVNGVYVGGTTAGVLASAKLAGTAGDLQATMVLDPLICDTEAVAARARAISVLSQSGPGSTLSVETLLMPADAADPPVLVEPGRIVRLSEEMTVARGVSVSAVFSASRGLEVWQTMELEHREVEA